jgi:hypothetical protein
MHVFRLQLQFHLLQCCPRLHPQDYLQLLDHHLRYHHTRLAHLGNRVGDWVAWSRPARYGNVMLFMEIRLNCSGKEN